MKIAANPCRCRCLPGKTGGLPRCGTIWPGGHIGGQFPVRIPNEKWISLEVVTGGFDAADDWIVRHVAPLDIVVTADILLADRCLKEGAQVIGASGKPLTEDNIGSAIGLTGDRKI